MNTINKRGVNSKTKKAFTLIELVIVIAILGILAVASLPVYINMRAQSIEAKEDSIFAAMKEAVTIQHMQNLSNHIEEWPSENPLELLSPHVLNKPHPGPAGSNDGINWTWRHNTSAHCWYIHCPHYNGSFGGSNATQGRFYVYCYGSNGVLSMEPGEWRVYQDLGH